MQRKQNILFLVLAAVMLSACIIHGAVASILPDYQIRHRSSLEARTVFSKPSFSIGRVLSGAFQSDAEKAFADAVPFRDELLLGNAALQRLGTRTADMLFGFGVFHSFYGSRYVIDTQHHAFAREPNKWSESTLQRLQSSAACVNALIAASPQSDWVCIVPDFVQYSEANPAYGLVSDSAGYHDCLDAFSEILDDRCQIIDIGVDDTDEFYELFFHTDHHWGVQGALLGYRAVADVLGFEPLPEQEPIVGFGGPFFGSQARIALSQEYSDAVLDVQYDSSHLDVWVEDEDYSGQWSLGGYGGVDSEPIVLDDRFQNAYAEYFHNDVALIRITNDAVEGGTLLIIGDSNTNCMERFFAASYRTVYVIDPRHYTGSIRGFLEEHEIDDVVIIANLSIVGRFAEYESMKVE